MEKQAKESRDIGNIAINAEISVYWHFLNFAAELLRVKLSYENGVEHSLLVRMTTGVNADFAPAALQRGCSQRQS